jgi:glycosyltransferase involved in cell wall biosynthesis
MILGKKVVVVMPAYNAAETLERTYHEIDRDLVDEIILTDDCSSDNTLQVARDLDLIVIAHRRNRGYGANQKTCYKKALEIGADIVIMVHPDYQYTPRIIPSIAYLLCTGFYDYVQGSRMLGRGAIKNGMPIYKYIANRVLSTFQNLVLAQGLSEYHTGYRGFTREVLEILPILENSDDYLFDNQILCQIIYFGFRIGEVSCPAHYSSEASSISFFRSCQYAFGVIETTFQLMGQNLGVYKTPIFNANGKRLIDLSDKETV